MGILEKEGGLPVFDNNILNTSFLPTAEMTAQLTGKNIFASCRRINGRGIVIVWKITLKLHIRQNNFHD